MFYFVDHSDMTVKPGHYAVDTNLPSVKKVISCKCEDGLGSTLLLTRVVTSDSFMVS